MLASPWQAAECTRKEHEWVFHGPDPQAVDSPYDDPVIASRMLGDDLTLEAGEGIGQQGYAGMSEFQVQAGESVSAGRGRACDEVLVLPS